MKAAASTILLTVLAQSAVDVLDETLLLFDQAISGRESAAKAKMTEALAERARGGENCQQLLDEILAIVLDPVVGDEQVGGLIRSRVGMERLRGAWAVKQERLPRDHGHLAMMDPSMTYLRQFAPAVLAAVQFAGGPGTEQLLQAVSLLAGLYATGTRKVPPSAPVGFVPTKCAGYLGAVTESGDVTAYRHYWELCVLVGLRDGLRSGDVFVPGSRRYADPASFLLTEQAWAPQRVEFCSLAGKPAAGVEAYAQPGARRSTLGSQRGTRRTQTVGRPPAAVQRLSIPPHVRTTVRTSARRRIHLVHHVP
jgi:hypothetical protein